jgi:hypothetical protein
LPAWRAVSTSPLPASAIADLVPGPNGLLVAYVLSDDELLVVTVARGENGPDVAAVAAPINRRGLADALAATLQPSALQDSAAWTKRAAPLTKALLAPIASRLTGRDRLVIIPDDLLWKVPFEALPFGDRDLASAATVTYATSLATLSLQKQLPLLPERRVSAVVAAPAIPDAVRAQLRLMLPAWTPPDPAVAIAAAQTVTASYGQQATMQTTADASEATVRRLLGAADVLHLQVPLLVSSTAPLLSSILLASTGDSPAEDGRLETREWFAMTGRTRVIVLPDGSAFGVAGVGNAMDALAWAATAAGASTLVLGRWPADGFVADPLAAMFHAKLAAGATPLDAWRTAVAALREQVPAPAGWAGLRLIGGA